MPLRHFSWPVNKVTDADPPELAPISTAERVVNLDVLRALALFGVLMVNLLTEFRVSIFEQFLGPASGSIWDRITDRFVAVAVESKAFALFSLLFGMGLAIQNQRARERGGSFGRYVTRRMGALFAIGVVHLVFVWNGDILTEYAIAGALVAPLIGRSRGVLLVAAAFLVAVYVAPLPYPEPFADADAIAAHVAEANRVYARGGVREILAFRVHELRPILALDFSVLPRTMGLFALGAWIWRAGIFQRPEEHRRLLRWTCAAGLVLGGGAALYAGGLLTEGAPHLGPWGGVLDGLGTITLALGYAAAVALAFERPGVRRLLALTAPLGRMALTSYLTQSVVLGLVFYGCHG